MTPSLAATDPGCIFEMYTPSSRVKPWSKLLPRESTLDELPR